MIDFSIVFDVYQLVILIFRVYCYISICILPFVLYNSFFESRYKPNSNYYHKKEWYHFLKVLWAKSAVKKFKKSFADAIKNESDDSLEQPRKLTTFMRSDTQVIYGVDQNGNSLYLRITLREKRLSESCVQIRLSNGQIFQLPEHPLTLLCSIPERKWQAKGLELEVIEPFTTLKITYNGFLRNVIRLNEDEESGDVVHCQFNFIWSAATEAKFFPQEASTQELAEAIAVEPWKDAKWIKLLGYHTGYDQYGSLLGTFTFSTISPSPSKPPTPQTSFTPFAVPFPSPTSLISPSTTHPTSCSVSPAYKGIGSSAHVYSTVQLRLSACRKRAWGPGEARVLHRMLTLFGADGKGFAFSVGVRSYAKGCKELLLGTAMLPNRNVLFIENCDISLPDFFEDGIIPGAFCFSFKASGQHYKCTAFNHKTSIADIKNEESSGCNGKLVRIQYIINGEEVSGYGVFWYKSQGKGAELPPYIIRPGIQTIEPERKYVASLNSPECRSTYLAGSKGTSLALLTAIQTDKFNTLDGFCVLAPALEKHLEKNIQLKEELTKMNEIACGIIEGNLKETCDRVQHLFSSIPLQQLLLDLVTRELTLLKFSLTPVSTENEVKFCWAVRGSSVHQDLGDKPLELRDRTFLDCFTDEDVVKAITRCWGGVYEYEKVVYRRKRGLPILCDMAVVVQPTLAAESSGIISTIDPSTGNPSQMTIIANYGLNVVTTSQNTTPTSMDTITIARTWCGNLTIATSTPGTKLHKVIVSDTGIAKVENNLNSGLCLTKDLLLQIARAAVEVEKALGGPVKIEWGAYKDQIYIITCTLLRPPVAHDTPPCTGNTPIMSLRDCIIIQSTDNLLGGNDPCCELSTSTCVRYLDHALQRIYEGRETRRGGYKKLGVVEGVVGCDVYQTILRNVEKDITEELKIHELMTTGKSFVSKDLNQEAIFRNHVTKLPDTIVNFYRTFTYCWNSSDNTEEARVLSHAIKMTSHPDLTAFEHFKVIKRNLHLLKHIIYLHTSVNQSYVFYQKLFLNLMHEDRSELSSSSLQNFLDHYSSSSVYQTASRVELLAAVLHSRHLGDVFSDLRPEEAVSWLEENAPDCIELIERIMGKIGFRAVGEFDLASDPWENNTFALIRIVQKLIEKMEKDKKNESELYNNVAGKPEKVPIKINGKILRWLDSRLHNIFYRRSKTQEAVSRTINKFRWTFDDLGRRLVHEGKLPDHRLVFHLTLKDLGVLVKKKRPELIDRAMHRLILHNTLKPNIPDIYTGEMATILDEEGTTFEQQQQQQRVIGNTVVGGNVVGRVCVLENIRQVELVQPDDILITKTLDLAWSPYFGLISGIICETGSIITQGAIAAHKRNLPCIIAKKVTSIFKTGDRVMMIGNTGVVEKILTKDI